MRQWVLSLPIPLRLLLAAQPQLLTPVLRVVHRVLTRFLLEQAGLKSDQTDSGAVTLIQRFGSAANLNIHLHCLVLDDVYRRNDAEPVFVEAPAPTDEALQAVLHKSIGRILKLLTRRGALVEEQGSTFVADVDADSDDAHTLRPLAKPQLALTASRLVPGPARSVKCRTWPSHGQGKRAFEFPISPARQVQPPSACRKSGDVMVILLARALRRPVQRYMKLFNSGVVMARSR